MCGEARKAERVHAGSAPGQRQEHLVDSGSYAAPTSGGRHFAGRHGDFRQTLLTLREGCEDHFARYRLDLRDVLAQTSSPTLSAAPSMTTIVPSSR